MRQLIRKFLELESSSSILLLGAALIAMVWANSPLAFLHQQFITSCLFIINEGLMTLFFLLVGLELKRGFLQGQLSNLRQVMLPLVGAIGGMLIPAGVYLIINHGNAVTFPGWTIPVATDIAFALGVLSLFGNRISQELKLFLLALAIFDDIGAIAIIATYFAQGISYFWLSLALVTLLILYLLNYFSVRSLLPYLIVGIFLWICFLCAGIHPTLSGVVLALMIPGSVDHDSPLQQLEDQLHPWSAYVVMPLFALANAGFSLQEISLEIIFNRVVMGITLGLFLGKQVGVLGFSWLMIQLRLAKLPDRSSWLTFYGTAILCGIGFTMSLFLGTLAFQNESIYLAEVRLGVMLGSILSGFMGALIFLISFIDKE